MKLIKYSLDQLKDAIKTSYSYRQVLQKLKVKAAGGNYLVLKKAIKEFNLDISHFTHQAWNKGRTFSNKYQNFDTYIKKSSSLQSYKAKQKIIREELLPNKCSNCNKTNWLEGPIPLELDHIDGNNQNYDLKNLRLICPNCHALTSTYRGKNKKPKA